MRKFIEQYDKSIINLIGSIQVSDKNGHVLDMYDGIEAVCTAIQDLSKPGNKVIFIGNGGSAAIASHMATDFWKNGGIKSLAFNDGSLLTCMGNDFGYASVFEQPIAFFAERGDALFAISSSGRSENILRGVGAAESKGCHIITLSGFDADNPLRARGKWNFYVPSHDYGPVEVIHQYICHYVLDAIVKHKS